MTNIKAMADHNKVCIVYQLFQNLQLIDNQQKEYKHNRAVNYFKKSGGRYTPAPKDFLTK